MKYSHLTLDQRVVLAEKGNKKTLDELVHDDDYRVRELVANHGYRKHLDILVNDPSSYVRGEVATCGNKKDLEKLLNDDDSIRLYAEGRLREMK